MKKLLLIVVVLALVLAFASVGFAHPPTPEQSIGVANAAAKDGLHKAAGNVDGIAAHVLLFRVSPHRK